MTDSASLAPIYHVLSSLRFLFLLFRKRRGEQELNFFSFATKLTKALASRFFSYKGDFSLYPPPPPEPFLGSGGWGRRGRESRSSPRTKPTSSKRLKWPQLPRPFKGEQTEKSEQIQTKIILKNIPNPREYLPVRLRNWVTFYGELARAAQW